MKLRPFEWVINAAEAKQVIETGALILDVRSGIVRKLGQVSKARSVNWQQFSQPTPPNKGKLLTNSQVLEQKLRQIGLSNHQPVIVVGNPRHPLHFGEEGRIVWMLHTLGHSQAAFVDGGHAALIKAGLGLEIWGSPPLQGGDFKINPTDTWEISAQQLQSSLANPQNLTVVDNREAREYAGATLYGEKRGGHIPGAVHFCFKELLHPQGYLRSPKQINDRLKQVGIYKNSDRPIVAYCTGGIRSAFFVAVLVSLGYTNIKSYSGSMWEWSQAESFDYPLENSRLFSV